MKPLQIGMLFIVIAVIISLPRCMKKYTHKVVVGSALDKATIAELQAQNILLEGKLEECRQTQFKRR